METPNTKSIVKPDPRAQASAQALPRRAPGSWGVTAVDFYRQLENKPAHLVTLDGKIYNGTLVGVDQYDLAFRLIGGEIFLFAKHALKYVGPGHRTNGSAKE